MILIFFFLALAGLFLNFKNSLKALSFLTMLFIMTVAYFLMPLITPITSHYSFLGLIGIFLASNFIVGSFIENKWLKFSLPLLSLGLLFALGGNELQFENYTLDFRSPKTLILPFLGYLALFILDMKLLVVPKYFKNVNVEYLENAVVLIVVGFFTIIATFLASWFGFFLMALGAFAYNSFASQARNHIIISLIGLAAISSFMQTYSVDAIDVSIGKLMAGLMVGFGALSLTLLVQSLQNKFLSIVIALASAGLLVVILKFNSIHPAYGGIEAFLAAIIGISIGAIIYRESYATIYLLPLTFVLGLSLSNDPFANTEIVSVVGEKDSKEITTKEKDIVDSQKGEEWIDLEGTYSVDPTSIISFKLGPKGGVTKGEIKNFEGEIVLAESITSSSFKLTLPVVNLSTFNSMRDESLMEADYFNEAKFPVMKFVSTSMEAKEDGYILKGSFTLLGKTNAQDVFIKYVGTKENKQVFVGKASLDKTKFGMTPSAQEGDIVDFSFQLLLIN